MINLKKIKETEVVEIKPEAKVEMRLWDWLKQNPSVEVYFNRKNILGWKKFTTKGINKRPDLLIKFIDKFNGVQYIAVEVKDGRTNRNLREAYKIFSIYYINYVEGKTKYFINGTEIKINNFVVATQFSPLGHIMFNDRLIEDNIDKGNNDQWRNMSAQNKTLPRCEFEKTRSYLRSIWAQFKPYREKISGNIRPGLGILESDLLTKFSPEELRIQSGMEGKPIISVMGWKHWLKKPQWQQTLIKIGEDNEY